MNTSDVLNTAADLIEERGWAQGPGAWDFEDKPGAALCVEGGIQAALGVAFASESIEACPAYRAVHAYLNLEDSPLWAWNDDQHDATRVVEVLRACAVIEASRERETAGVA